MQITAIVQAIKRSDRVNIFLDGNFWLSLAKNELLELGLSKGQELTLEIVARVKQVSDKGKLLDKVLKFISLRPRSEKEVSDYLVLRKGIQKVEAAEIVATLKAKGFVSDHAFAKWYIENRLSFGFHGHNKIRAELVSKGLKVSEINRVLDQLTTKEQTAEKLLKLIEKLDKSVGALSPQARRQKITSRLLARGYNYSDFSELLRRNLT